jgi:phage minor structural protein
MPQIVVYGLTGDGQVQRYGTGATPSAWSANAAAATGDSVSTALTDLDLYVADIFYLSLYRSTIRRGYTYFNVAGALPTGAEITSAVLWLYVSERNDWPDEGRYCSPLYVSAGMPTYPTDVAGVPALAVGDYGDANYATIAQIARNSIVVGAYNGFTIPLANVAASGLTKFRLTQTSNAGSEYAALSYKVASADAPTNQPYMLITYSFPVNAECSIEAAAEVAPAGGARRMAAAAINAVAVDANSGTILGQPVERWGTAGAVAAVEMRARADYVGTPTFGSVSPSGPVVIYDRANFNPLAHLDAYAVSVEERINEVWTASFSLPIDDPHVDLIDLLDFAELWDEDTRIGLFRILRRKTSRADGKTITYECEHVLGMLRDPKLTATTYAGPGTVDSINAILDLQTHWELVTCDFNEAYLYKWEAGASLLEALLDIPERFHSDYQWTWDTTSYPWQLNLVVPPTVVTAYVDYGRNLKGITKDEDTAGMFTRLYAYGGGAGADQITLAVANPSGLEYINAGTLATYGTIVKVWVDQNYTTSAQLYEAASAYLDAYSIPRVTYTVEAAELYRLTAETIDRFTLGSLVKITDDDLGIEVDVRVVGITRGDIDGQPGVVSLELANKSEEFDFRRYIETNDLSTVDITNIPGGTPGALPEAPEGEGLFISTDHMGYHDGIEWITYMDSSGRLYLEGGVDAYFRFDPTLGTLAIRATSIDLEGLVNIIDTANIADAAITTAKIQNLAVTNAKIDTLNVNKLVSGTMTGNYIQLAGDGARLGIGKTSYSDTTAGIFMGVLGVNALVNIGDTSAYFKWTGTGALLKGPIDTVGQPIRSWIGQDSLYITGSIIMNRAAPDGDGAYHSIYGVDDLRYTSTRFLNLGTGVWQHVDSPLQTIGFSGNNVRLQALASDAVIEFRSENMPGTLSLDNWSLTGTGAATQAGWIKWKLGDAVFYSRLYTT